MYICYVYVAVWLCCSCLVSVPLFLLSFLDIHFIASLSFSLPIRWRRQDETAVVVDVRVHRSHRRRAIQLLLLLLLGLLLIFSIVVNNGRDHGRKSLTQFRQIGRLGKDAGQIVAVRHFVCNDLNEEK